MTQQVAARRQVERLRRAADAPEKNCRSERAAAGRFVFGDYRLRSVRLGLVLARPALNLLPGLRLVAGLGFITRCVHLPACDAYHLVPGHLKAVAPSQDRSLQLVVAS